MLTRGTQISTELFEAVIINKGQKVRVNVNVPCDLAEQVNEIRRGSISRLICDNADDVKSMQPRGFVQISQE
jgi:hypothetical protein